MSTAAVTATEVNAKKAHDLGMLLASVTDRLRREGKPIPAHQRPDGTQ